MPVPDHPVHPLTRFDSLPLAQCNTRRATPNRRASYPVPVRQINALGELVGVGIEHVADVLSNDGCRQIGRLIGRSAEWEDLPECAGCEAPRAPYVTQARRDVLVELGRIPAPKAAR